jgi:low affinity Fe/Cu permease
VKTVRCAIYTRKSTEEGLQQEFNSQLKIDELLRAVRGAQNAFINLEDLSEEDLNRLKKRYAAIAVSAREKSNLQSPDIEPASGTPQTSSE